MSLNLILKNTVLGRILMLLGVGAIFVLIFEFWAFSYKTRTDAANENHLQITQAMNALQADIAARNALYKRLTHHDLFWIKQHFSGFWQLNADTHSMLFNDAPIADQQVYIDRFSSNGSTAGVLVRKGDLFSFELSGNKALVNKTLGKDDPAIAALLAGRSYQGIFPDAGQWSYRVFEPIKNADNVVIGALYSGINITSDIQQLIEHTRTIAIGQHGYVSIINVNKGASFGMPVFHPLSHQTAEQITQIEKQDMRQVEEQFEAIIFAQDEMAQRIDKIVDSMILQREVADNITHAANETHVVSEQTNQAAQTMNLLSESTSQISERLLDAVNGFKV